VNWDDVAKVVLALAMWREARGEGTAGMTAVGCVIRNNVKGNNWIAVITKPYFISSLTAHADPELIIWPKLNDLQFSIAMMLAEGIMSYAILDVTDGATHYFNPNVVLPTWAASMKKVKTIGNHDFYVEDTPTSIKS
jgi:N-acetylmuramoyl-L-alanine amidase